MILESAKAELEKTEGVHARVALGGSKEDVVVIGANYDRNRLQNDLLSLLVRWVM